MASQVSFTLPGSEYQAEADRIARQKRMAEALQQDAMQPMAMPQQPGVYVSPLEGVAKLLKAWGGVKGMRRADEEQKTLANQVQERRGADMSAFVKALRGREATPGGLVEDASGNVTQADPIAAQTASQSLQQVLPMLQTPEIQQAGLGAMLQAIKDEKPKDPKWQVTEKFDANGRPVKVLVNLNDPTQTMPFGDAKRPEILQPGVEDAQARVRAAGRPQTTIVNSQPGDDKYLQERRKAQAARFGELEKSAESAYKQIQTLDRFIEASNKGTSGGAQPIISGVQNFLSSFGYTPEQLKDVRVMEQAIGDILGNKMAELGARGLTDKDMEILRQALPRVNVDKDSRIAIAEILKKTAASTLGEYENARAEEERIYPEFSKKTPVQSWFKAYKDTKNKVIEVDW